VKPVTAIYVAYSHAKVKVLKNKQKKLLKTLCLKFNVLWKFKFHEFRLTLFLHCTNIFLVDKLMYLQGFFNFND
jgi:hypothetical protein